MAVQDRYREFLPDQRQFFDELVVEDWHTYDCRDWDTQRRFEVACLFKLIKPATVIDVGCGCGFHDVVMAGYDFVARVDAFDYSARSIEQANHHYPHAKVTRSVADIASVPAGPGYDLVVSFQVIEHLNQPLEFLRRQRGLCRPGGHVAIVTPNRLRLDNRIRRWRGNSEQVMDPQHFAEYSRTEIEAMATAAGLIPIGHFGHGLQASSLRWLARLPMAWRCRLGSALPSLAGVIGIVCQRPETDTPCA